MRFVVYGMAREKVINLIRSLAPEGTTVQARSDYQAAHDIKTGQADVAIGLIPWEIAANKQPLPSLCPN